MTAVRQKKHIPLSWYYFLYFYVIFLDVLTDFKSVNNDFSTGPGIIMPHFIPSAAGRLNNCICPG
jgi:hypothetical protein